VKGKDAIKDQQRWCYCTSGYGNGECFDTTLARTMVWHSDDADLAQTNTPHGEIGLLFTTNDI
jgi:hypothetical protein